MKKLLRILLIITLTFSPLEAKAFTLCDTQVKNDVEKLVIERYKKYTDAELNVRVMAVPFKTIKIPNGKLTFQIESNLDKFMARDLEKVTVLVDGKAVKKFNVPIQVKAYADVLVASCTITREKAITSNVANVEKKEVSEIIEYVLKPNSLNNELVSKKYFAKGDIIDRRFVKLKPDILRNSTVTAFFHTNNLTVALDVKALSDGVIGENICIMNKDYNKIYKGTVIGENKVLIEI